MDFFIERLAYFEFFSERLASTENFSGVHASTVPPINPPTLSFRLIYYFLIFSRFYYFLNFHLTPRRTRIGYWWFKDVILHELCWWHFVFYDEHCLLKHFNQLYPTQNDRIFFESTSIHKCNSPWKKVLLLLGWLVKDDRGMKWRQHQSNKPPPWQPFDRGEICISVWPPNFNCKVLSTSTQLQRYTECLFFIVFVLILSNRWRTQATMLFSWGLSDSDGMI